jgi:hypothetical protein
LASQHPENLGDLHHGVVVFGGSGFGAENMFEPDSVIFLGVECVFDPVSFSSDLDNFYDSVGCKIGKIGDESIKLGTMGSDFSGQYRVSGPLAQHQILNPAVIQPPLLAIETQIDSQDIASGAGKQLDYLLPSGGLEPETIGEKGAGIAASD